MVRVCFCVPPPQTALQVLQEDHPDTAQLTGAGVGAGVGVGTGVEVGVTGSEEILAEVPEALLAFNANVYEVPNVSPDMVMGLLVDVEIKPPGEEVTVYNNDTPFVSVKVIVAVVVDKDTDGFDNRETVGTGFTKTELDGREFVDPDGLVEVTKNL
jgi:hypothetical protein